jgi:hypothetical protein
MLYEKTVWAISKIDIIEIYFAIICNCGRSYVQAPPDI